jgi:hypothetical protein
VAGTPRIALVGEARGEWDFLRKVSGHLDDLVAPGTGLQIEMDARDLSSEERVWTLVPAEQPLFQQALALPDDELAARVAEAEAQFGIPNLRRLWRGDILYWRDGVPEEQLARQALGYVAVFDELYRTTPELVGGFAEESARMIKRIFRSVSLHHGRRMIISISFFLANKIVLVDQEDFDAGLPPFESFVPSDEDASFARGYIDGVRNGSVAFGGGRDLRVTPARLRNLVRLAARAAKPSEPGDQNARPLTFIRDFAVQRFRTTAHRAVSMRDLPESARAVFYPFHHNNDSHLTIRGDGWRNQLATVEHLANSLPYGWEVWVKPHPHSPGDLAVSRLLTLARRLPNLRLIDWQVPARAILDRVQTVVTVNSTAGFEALVLGIPVVTLGKSHYRGRGLTYDVGDPAELPALLRTAIHGAPPDADRVERLVAYYKHTGRDLALIGLDASEANAERYAKALVDEFNLARTAASA